MFSLSPTLNNWLAVCGATRVERVFPDAVPGHTFTAYYPEGPIQRDLSSYYRVVFPTHSPVESLVQSLNQLAGIVEAYPSPIPIPLSDIRPDDSACVMTATYLDSLYFLLPPNDTLAGVDAIGAWQEACMVLQEAPPVIIGLHDNGFGTDPNWHHDIRAAISPGSRVGFSDLGVHGSAVGSVIAAADAPPQSNEPCPMCRPLPTNAQGMLGVLPVAKLLVSDNSTDRLGSLKFLIDSTPARVINMSWAYYARDPALIAILDKAYFEKQIVLVAGTGNCGSPYLERCYDLAWPAAHAGVIAVGSREFHNHSKSTFSNPGFQLLLAPGEAIFSAGGEPKFAGDLIGINQGYKRKTGTSMSCAMVSAMAALIRQARPDISPYSIPDILAAASINWGGTWGWNRETGYGLVNARTAVRNAIDTRCGNIPGDVNKDCFVNEADVKMLSEYIGANGQLTSPLNADVDSNCSIDNSDLSLIWYLAFWGGANTLKHGCLTVPHPEIVDEKRAAPAEFATDLGNYPNPFNAATVIEFSTPAETEYTLTVFDILGRVVDKSTGRSVIGRNRVTWDGSKAASGIYVYKVQVGRHSEHKKMLLLK